MASLLDFDDYGRAVPNISAPPAADRPSDPNRISLLTGGPSVPDVGSFLDSLRDFIGNQGSQIQDENLRAVGLDPDVVRFHQGLLADHPELRLPQTPAGPGQIWNPANPVGTSALTPATVSTSDPYRPAIPDPQAQIDAANTRFAGDLGVKLGSTFEGGLKVPTRAGNIARVDVRDPANQLVDVKPMTGRAVGSMLDEHLAAPDAVDLYGARSGTQGGPADVPVTLPPGVTSARDLATRSQQMVDRTTEMTRDIPPGTTPPRYWYQAGAEATHDLTGQDLPATERLLGSLAITSPQTDVPGNANQTVNAWNQSLLGEPIQVSSGPKNAALEDALYGSELPATRKTGPFYENHMRNLDPTFANNLTNDIWQMRESGFTGPQGAPYSGTPSTGEDNYVRMMVDRATRQLNANNVDGGNWTPEQVQAALWVHTKTLQQTGNATPASYHFGDAMERLTAGQSNAHAAGPALLGPNAADPQAQADFSQAASGLLNDPMGRDIVNSSLGLLTPPGKPGAAAVAITGDGIKPASRTLMDASTLMRATLLRQPAAMWTAHPDVAGLPTYANANVVHSFSGNPDDHAMALREALDSAGGGLEGAVLQQSPAGVRIINVGQRTGLTNPDFQAATKAAITDAGLPADMQRARADYGYFTHDWTADPTGSGYIAALGRLPPHLQRIGDQLFAGLGRGLDAAGSTVSGRAPGASGLPGGGTGPWAVPGFTQAVGTPPPTLPIRPWLQRPSPTDLPSRLPGLLGGVSP